MKGQIRFGAKPACRGAFRNRPTARSTRVRSISIARSACRSWRRIRMSKTPGGVALLHDARSIGGFAVAVVANLRAAETHGLKGPWAFTKSIDFIPERPARRRPRRAHLHLHGASPGNDARGSGQPDSRRRDSPALSLRSREFAPWSRCCSNGFPFARLRIKETAAREARCRCAQPAEGPPIAHGPAATALPQTLLLGNGRYSVMVTNSGSGYSRWKQFDITRWRADADSRPMGNIRSAARSALQCDVVGHASARERRSRRSFGCVFGGSRRVPPRASGHRNGNERHGQRGRRCRGAQAHRHRTGRAVAVPWKSLRLLELALAPHAADAAHPAFGKMFVETESTEDGVIVAHRRPRSPRTTPLWVAHMLVGASGGVEFETRPPDISGPRAIHRGRGSFGPIAQRHGGRGARSDRQPAMPRNSGTARQAGAVFRDDGRAFARGALQADRKVPPAGVRGARSGSGMDARATGISPPADWRGSGAQLPAARRISDLSRFAAAAAGLPPARKPSAGNATCGRWESPEICRSSRSRFAEQAGLETASRGPRSSLLLESARISGRPGHPESGSAQLRSSPEFSAPAHSRRAYQGSGNGSSWRSVPPRLVTRFRSRSAPAAEQFSSWFLNGAGARSRGNFRAFASYPPRTLRLRSCRDACRGAFAAAALPGTVLLQRRGRILARWPGVRDLSRARHRDAFAMGQRDRDAGFRLHGDGKRAGVHVARKQPEEPADDMAERSGERSRSRRRSICATRTPAPSGHRPACRFAKRTPTAPATDKATPCSNTTATRSARN